jgi:hypothetical protein
MSVFGTIASETVQPRYIFHWLWTRLALYLTVAAGSAILFFAGAFIYAHFMTNQLDAPNQNPVAPTTNIPSPQNSQPTPASPTRDLMVKLPSGEELPFTSIDKRVVEDNAGQPVGYVIGLSPQSWGQAIVVSVQTGGLNKTVGIPAMSIGKVETKKSIQANLPRETIVTSPTYANIGGIWQRAP